MSQQLLQNATKAITNVTGFIKTLAKNAPALALTAAAVPNIMDFMSGLLSPFEDVGDAVEDLGFTASEGFEKMATDITNSIYELEPVAQQLGNWVGDTYDKVQEKDWEGLSTNIETGLTSAWGSIGDFFADTELMTDIGEGAAAVVTGITNFLLETTPGEWDVIFDGIVVGMTAFFNNVEWDKVLAGIYNAYVALAESIAETTWEILFGGQGVGGDAENDPYDPDPGEPR